MEGTEMRRTAWKVLAGCLAVSVVALSGASRRARAQPPADWFGGGEGYERSLDAAEKHGGKSSGSLKSTGDEANGFGTLLQFFKAEKYRGKRLRLSAFVKS